MGVAPTRGNARLPHPNIAAPPSAAPTHGDARLPGLVRLVVGSGCSLGVRPRAVESLRRRLCGVLWLRRGLPCCRLASGRCFWIGNAVLDRNGASWIGNNLSRTAQPIQESPTGPMRLLKPNTSMRGACTLWESAGLGTVAGRYKSPARMNLRRIMARPPVHPSTRPYGRPCVHARGRAR